MKILQNKCNFDNYRKLETLENPVLQEFISKYVSLCNPKSVFIRTDSSEDKQYLRNKALELGEERPLNLTGHTIHFDGFLDQARDKKATKYLLAQNQDLGTHLNSIDRKEGLEEITAYLKDIMTGKEMIVGIFCLGPLDSEFSIPAVQITDSYYVAHSEIILYRTGYEFFKKEKPDRFFKFVHSAGELKNCVSKNVDKRRIYIDLAENTVYTVNTQYAGNTVGLKKLALRLAINRAEKEGWLAEHMFIMGINGPDKRKIYFAGAFPSGCGKTSTAMISEETIVGDDIAYLRERKGEVFAVNVESGIFGIIQNVNAKDDPLIWQAITKPGEIIFTNSLVTEDNRLRWLGDERPLPEKGISFCGEWFSEKKDEKGKVIPYAHKNARYTARLKFLANCDSELDNPKGVKIEGIIYGGRDSDTWLPVCESFDWVHGVVSVGASLESEVTFATLDKEGERKFNPFSNLDFLSVPIGRYIDMYLNFGKRLSSPARIFAVNYFLKDEAGNFLTDKKAKHVWIKWMTLRICNKTKVISTPLGLIPEYEDLKRLFKEVLGQDYPRENYIQQFSLRIDNALAKIERIEKIYKDIEKIPSLFFETLDEQKKRLKRAKNESGPVISPEAFLKQE